MDWEGRMSNKNCLGSFNIKVGEKYAGITVDVNLNDRVSSAYVYRSGYWNDDFQMAVKAMEIAGYKVISLKEAAVLRLIEGKNWPRESFKPYPVISDKGFTTKEAFIYVPKKGLFITKNSPMMETPESVERGKEYYLTDEQVEKALTDAVEVKVEGVPTRRFAENEITNYLFGGVAKEYGEYLSGTISEIRTVAIHYEQGGERAFARQVFFGDLYRALFSEDWHSSCLTGRKFGERSDLRGIKIIEKDGFWEKSRKRFFPTEFEQYLSLPENRSSLEQRPPEICDRNDNLNDVLMGVHKNIEQVKSITREMRRKISGEEETHPEISRLAQSLGMSPEQEERTKDVYVKVLKNFEDD